jgi:hypothetical protein
MFAVYCPYEDARVLLGPTRIVAVEHGSDGFTIHYRCWCGHEGAHTVARAGASAAAAVPATVAVPANAAVPATVAAAVPATVAAVDLRGTPDVVPVPAAC